MDAFASFATMIRFCIDEPDYSNVPDIKDHDLEHSVYGKHEEDVPIDAPPLLGRELSLLTTLMLV